MSHPPVLVLDLDGTLVETAPDLVATLNRILVREGLRPIPTEHAPEMIGQGAKVMLERGFRANGKTIGGSRLEALFADFVEHYSAHIADESRPYPGVIAVLDRFRGAGWRLAVCTNKLESLTRRLLDELELTSRFAAICGPDTFNVRKPDPTHLIKTIEAAGGITGNAVMVGDSASDINAAKAAGVPVVAVDFGYTDTPVDQLGPDRIISHFDALWDAIAGLRMRSLT